MAKVASARRHAHAVFQIALEENRLEGWQADLEAMSAALRDHRLAALLRNPKIQLDKKVELLKSVLGGISPMAMNLAYLLVARNRLGIFEDLVAEYNRRTDAYQGREHADVITAISLSKGDKERLKARLAEAIGKEVVVTTKVDPRIIGGLIIKVGDRLIDGSTRTRLQRLRESLVEAELEVG